MNYKEPQALTDVAKFMKAFTQPVLDVPTIPSADRCDLRVKLIQEELDELKVGIQSKDIVECADAFADLQYVLSGAIHEFGLGERFGNIFDNVHQSNMSKICISYEEADDTLKHYKNQGIEVYSEKLEGDTYVIKRKVDNKVLKSINYSPAKLTTLVKGENVTTEIVDPIIQKLIFKRDELTNGIIDLDNFIESGTPSVDQIQRILLPLQLKAMESYRDILVTRIKSLQGI